MNDQSPAVSSIAKAGMLLFALSLGSCAFGDRVMLMKEFEASVPTDTGKRLAGKTVFVASFENQNDVNANWEGTTPVEPAAFRYAEMSDTAEAAWDIELAKQKKGKAPESLPIIGWVRNGFGMKTADVRTVTPLEDWLEQTLALEFAEQGAKIASSEAEADLTVSGVIRYCRVDVYMRNWADLVVDVEIRGRGGAPTRKTFHVTGKQTAWSGSSYEFYRTLRRCQQKLAWLLVAELSDAASSGS